MKITIDTEPFLVKFRAEIGGEVVERAWRQALPFDDTSVLKEVEDLEGFCQQLFENLDAAQRYALISVGVAELFRSEGKMPPAGQLEIEG